jgi:hypothetical protein
MTPAVDLLAVDLRALDGPALAGELAALTERLLGNKKFKGFNLTDIPLEFSLLFCEVAELLDAPGGEIGGELADVLLFLLSVAWMLGVAPQVLAAAVTGGMSLPAPEFVPLVGDAARIFEAWRRDKPAAVWVVSMWLRLLSNSRACGLDLLEIASEKMTENEARVYARAASGLHVRTGGAR